MEEGTPYRHAQRARPTRGDNYVVKAEALRKAILSIKTDKRPTRCFLCLGEISWNCLPAYCLISALRSTQFDFIYLVCRRARGEAYELATSRCVYNLSDLVPSKSSTFNYAIFLNSPTMATLIDLQLRPVCHLDDSVKDCVALASELTATGPQPLRSGWKLAAWGPGHVGLHVSWQRVEISRIGLSLALGDCPEFFIVARHLSVFTIKGSSGFA